MTFVCSVIFSSTCCKFIFQVNGSLSTKTGVAPERITWLIQDIIVNAGRITSSPGPISIASIATSRAAVPLLTAIPCFRSIRCAN